MMDNKRWEARDQQDIEKAEEMQSAGVSARGLSPSKRYKVNPAYSREPKALCANVMQLGLPPCEFGEGKFCHARKVCSSQLDLDDPEHLTPEAEKLYKRERKKALTHARKISSRMADDDSMSDEEYNKLVKKILEDPYGNGDVR